MQADISLTVDGQHHVLTVDTRTTLLDALRDHFKALAEYNLLKAAPDKSDHYAFKHTITQEVAYSLLPFALRRELHSAVAGWYERQHTDDVTPLYGLLAHHWSRAEAMDNALDYLEKAADDALRRHANEEAIRFYSEAIELDDKRGEPVHTASSRATHGDSPSDRAARHLRWHRRIGDAWCNLGRWDEGRHHFERALSFYGTEFHLRLLRGPRSPWRRLVGSREVLDRIVYSEIAERRRRPDPERRDVLSLLLTARDEDGSGLEDEEVRDQVMTLLLAGHETTAMALVWALAAIDQAKVGLKNGDILIICQKIVSKAESAIVDLKTITPSPFAQQIAKQWEKDPRVVEVVLRESSRTAGPFLNASIRSRIHAGRWAVPSGSPPPAAGACPGGAPAGPGGAPRRALLGRRTRHGVRDPAG